MSKLHDIVFLAVALWLTTMLATSARAQVCAASISDMNFGMVDTLSEENTDSTAILTIGCRGLQNFTVQVCANLRKGSGGALDHMRQMTSNDTDKLNYQLYADAARTAVWGEFMGNDSIPNANFALGPLGIVSRSFTIYGRVDGRMPAHPGAYSSLFSGQEVEIRYHYKDGVSCNAGAGSVASVQFAVNATVQSNCSVSADDIDFGSIGVLDKNVDATGQLTIACTPGTSYNIALGDGNNGTGPTQRKMALGDQRVTYGLYRDAAHMQPWGNIVQDSVTGTGSGTTQSLNVYGRVPTQSTPSPGTYTDTVVVTVTY